MRNLKRNQVKLHDNVFRLIQDREQDREERKIEMEIIMDLRREIKILVRSIFSY